MCQSLERKKQYGVNLLLPAAKFVPDRLDGSELHASKEIICTEIFYIEIFCQTDRKLIGNEF